MALCETVKEAVYLQQLLEEIGLKALPVTIYEDNQPCIHIASNPVTSNRSKHIAVRYHYVREVISNEKYKFFINLLRRCSRLPHKESCKG